MGAQVAALHQALEDMRNTVAGFHMEPPTDEDVMNACIDAELARRNLPAAAARYLAAERVEGMGGWHGGVGRVAGGGRTMTPNAKKRGTER